MHTGEPRLTACIKHRACDMLPQHSVVKFKVDFTSNWINQENVYEGIKDVVYGSPDMRKLVNKSV